MRGVGSIWGPGVGGHIANTGDLLPAGQELRAICEEKNAQLLVIDPLSGAFGNNENDRTTVYDFISDFRMWADTAECAVLMIGHLPKSVEGKAAGFSGSTAWEASMRSMMMLSKEEEPGKKGEPSKGQYFVLLHTKSNYAPIQRDIYLIKDHFGWWQSAADKKEAIKGYKDYTDSVENRQEEQDEQDEYSGISL